MLDPETIVSQLRPEVRDRMREIVTQTAGLQAELAGLMADEAERLSTNAAEEEQARTALSAFVGGLVLGALQTEAELAAAPAN